jgi:diguanylate cyclase (GGDEF)-like protein
VAALSLLVDWHQTHGYVVIVIALAVCCLLGAYLQFKFGSRLPAWGLQVMISAGTVLISVAAAVGPSIHVNMAVLYCWVAVYAALYFEPLAVVLQTGAAGLAYMVVLATQHSGVADGFVAWTSIFGTSAVLAVVTMLLVGLYRRTSHENPLTELPNRRAWDERVDEELERAHRSGAPLSLALIDIDNFKEVNDHKGHQAGDVLLRQFADAWRGTVRGSGDFVARIGGDEFGLIVPNSNDEGVRLVAQRLEQTSPKGVSFSIGLATWDHVETAANLFRRADEEMYRIKLEKRAI